MFESYPICPYTGLRSFSEDESLYFKGREEDIDQATIQLQKNKFLMLTGASGDGKSSLVFAGIIPNARAGFLKSKYSNWNVAHFRPERTPFQNLCQALAKQLDIPNAFTVQGELNHGFSALADLYKNSKRYIDIHSKEWLEGDEKKKAAMKREAANLIILVDQFEEFFTNPENYQQGAPSRDANLVLNLLLETARIALDEDIPIFVIFTMRSDYIGQCAAFRGLPEYIGFSQFFVPRLNRSQLQQVIEEPATLSGNRISRRLTERLIHDLNEGVDQLPILQHALKQVWIAADSGSQEMDLIHYAMVGGMPVDELPSDQLPHFNEWFAALPENIKACYHAPGLQNVLDTHTNKLYEEAAGYYNTKTGKNISQADAKKIIRTAFTCLTKIDQSRAVRNRMTLREITHILGDPRYKDDTVGNVLNIFREPGNTFINPFISEDEPESRQLQPDIVLDITHESLIRNWQYLGRWAKEEFDSHTVSLDFEKQLDRWVNSGKSSNFLLSIGPLTYFENWYEKATPNAWWIARYLPEDGKRDNKLDHSRRILENSREFIQKSASKHVVTRTIMRYGPKRIAMIIGLIALLTLTSFTIRNYFYRQNGYVLNDLHQQAARLYGDPKVGLMNKTQLIAEEFKSGRTTPDEVMESIPDPVQRIRILNETAALLIYQGRDEPKKEIYRSVFLTDSLLHAYPFPENNPELISAVLKEINLFRVTLEFKYHYAPNQQTAEWLKRNAALASQWVLLIIDRQPPAFNDILNLDLALENGLNYRQFKPEDISRLIHTLSPFENGLSTQWLKTNFFIDKVQIRGASRGGYYFNFNGLYQDLAYLYAATGQTRRAMQCVDSLLLYNKGYYQGDYGTMSDNASHIVAVFFIHDKKTELNDFVKQYCNKTKIPEDDFYSRIIARGLHNVATALNLRLFPWQDGTGNLNIDFTKRSMLSFYFSQYRKVIDSMVRDSDQKNYLLALSYKNEGILKYINKESRDGDEMSTKEYFDKAWTYYQSVNPAYLEKTITVMDGTMEPGLAPRKYQFLYPDMRTAFHPGQPRFYFYYIFSDIFLDYILSNYKLKEFYKTPDELHYLEEWMDAYNTSNININAFLLYRPRYDVLKKLEKQLSEKELSGKSDYNYLYLYLGKQAQDSGRLDEMVSYYDKIDRSSLLNTVQQTEFFGYIRNQSMRMIARAMMGYLKTGQPDKMNNIAGLFKNPVNRSSLYAFTAIQLLKEKWDEKKVQPLIDSAILNMNNTTNTSGEQPNRRLVCYALSMQNPSGNLNQSYMVIRNLTTKLAATEDICRSFAFHNELYNGTENIPDNISGSDRADFIRFMLEGYQDGNSSIKPEWSEFTSNYVSFLNDPIIYVDENN